MKNFFKRDRWSPYVSGMLIGSLAASSIIFFKKGLGASTTLVKPVAFLWSLFNQNHLEQNLFYQEILKNKAWVDWQLMLIIGLLVGSFLSRWLSGTRVEIGPASRFNFRPLIGGFILMMGARIAGGCTSGHAITGGFQLAVSGWLFMIGLFAFGIPSAYLNYRKKSGGTL